MTNPTIYLLASEKSQFSADSALARFLSGRQRQATTDALFLEKPVGFPIATRYCAAHNIFVVELGSNVPNQTYSSMLQYIGEHPEANVLAHFGTFRYINDLENLVKNIASTVEVKSI